MRCSVNSEFRTLSYYAVRNVWQLRFQDFGINHAHQSYGFKNKEPQSARLCIQWQLFERYFLNFSQCFFISRFADFLHAHQVCRFVTSTYEVLSNAMITVVILVQRKIRRLEFVKKCLWFHSDFNINNTELS